MPRAPLEERLKHALVPPSLYIRYRAWKERLKGEAEIALLPSLVDPSRSAVDAGANKGVYSFVLSRLCPHVHAFEPYPKMLDVLRRTARRNVTVWSMALSDQAGEATFRVPRRDDGGLSNQGGSLSREKVSGDHLALNVATVRLDDLDLGPVGFMKIDVEGSEMQVLDGARATIERHRPTLLIEIEEGHSGIPLADAIGRVESLGYDASYYDRGQRRLRPFADYDPAALGIHGSRDYVFNFVFQPVAG